MPKRQFANFISSFLLLFLINCAAPPKMASPDLAVTTPENWVNASTAATASDTLWWWQSFSDSQLDSLVIEALAHNYNLQAAAGRIYAAAAQAKIQGADMWPQLNASIRGSRQRQNFVGLPFPGAEGQVLTNTSESVGLSLDLSWELDLWGRLYARKSAANADAQAALADFRGAQLSLAAQTAKAWFAAIEAHRQVAIAEATVENLQRSYNHVRSRYERGIRPSLDLRLALSNLAAAESIQYQRRQQLEMVQRQLEILLGRYPSASLQTHTELAQLPAPIPAGLPAEIVTRRPDLVAAERRLAASGARVKEARASLFPRLSLTASGGTLSNDVNDLLKGDFAVWSLVGNLLQPIFQGGRLRANVQLASAQSEQALANYAHSVLSAFGEVESALAAERYLAQRDSALTTATEQGLAARDLAEERYNSGLTDYVTVLESQRRAFELESQLYAVRRQRLEARVDLHLALGGGFEAAELLE